MLENYLKAFKTYDIRGISGNEINEKFMYILGLGMGNYILEKFGENGKIIIGSDVRESNSKYLPYFIKGLKGKGIQNIAFADFGNEDKNRYPFGICSTSTIYYLGQNDFDLGISVTASHNPKEYMGMKFFDKNVDLLPTSILRQYFEKEFFEGDYTDLQLPKIDTNFEKELIQSKKDKMLDFLGKKRSKITKKYKIVVDYSTGAGITVEKEFFEKIKDKHDFIYINDFADGTFSAHESDTTDNKNYTQLIQKINEYNADFGILFDGDVDRIGFATKQGDVIKCDIITAIIANQILQKTKGDIVFDSMSSKIIQDIANKYGVKGIRYKTGRSFINEQLANVEGVLGGEASGHYMFKEIGGFEMPLLAFYYVLLELENYDSFSDMVKNYTIYFKTPISSFKTEKKQEILEIIKKEFSEYKLKYLDGVSVFADDFRFNIRGSNSENKIRFCVEANTPSKRDEISQKIEKIILGQ